MKITLIVDVSASMTDKAEESTEGIRGLVKDNPKAKYTLVEFGGTNDPVKVVFEGKTARKLTKYKLKPQSNTPMLDGIGKGLSLIDHDDKNLVIIVTDGEENASHSWKIDQLKPLIAANEAAGTEFIFLGADVRSLEFADHVGIRTGRQFAFAANASGANAAYKVANVAAQRMSSGSVFMDLDTHLDAEVSKTKDIKKK